MEEKLQLGPSLKDAFAIGIKNCVSIVLAVLLWFITIWIPYLNVGTTIALSSLPVKLSQGNVINPTYIFDAEYRHCMGEYFILIAIISSAITAAMVFLLIPAIVLEFSWMLAIYLLVGKKMNWALCISESNRLMMGYKMKAFALKLVVAIAFGIVGGIFFSIFKSISDNFGIFALVIIVLVSICVSISVDAVIYRELVQKADNDLE